jgi:hypothetical protein
MNTLVRTRRSLPGHAVATHGHGTDVSTLLANVTIIVPVGPGDPSWRTLAKDLDDLGGGFETIFVAVEDRPVSFDSPSAGTRHQPRVHWIRTTPGRAHQMNRGATLAKRQILWFLHADTRLNISAASALHVALDQDADAIHYFDLEFQSDGPRLARLNSRGVRFRSRCLGLPFGDQKTFNALGGFPENVAYGEDHLLIWAARRHRVPVLPTGATITTSARKYSAQGWLATTSVHAWRTWRQAIPEFAKLVWSRLQ